MHLNILPFYTRSVLEHNASEHTACSLSQVRKERDIGTSPQIKAASDSQKSKSDRNLLDGLPDMSNSVLGYSASELAACFKKAEERDSGTSF